jgi:hypothetical protein
LPEHHQVLLKLLCGNFLSYNLPYKALKNNEGTLLIWQRLAYGIGLALSETFAPSIYPMDYGSHPDKTAEKPVRSVILL